MIEKASGYTLPVFACAAAIAALRYLHQELEANFVTVDLIKPPEKVKIAIEQVAKLIPQSALAITRSDPGEHLDITRNTPVWALVEVEEQRSRGDWQIEIRGGEGIGKQINNEGKAAIYNYAQRLIQENFKTLLHPNEKITVTIILPEGERLAQRTSNSAFGIVEGLSLLGTTGIVQPLTAPSQLEAYQTELKEKASKFDSLVFCIGENGLDLAKKLDINPARLVKTANWIGSMLVVAALEQVKSIVLFGYHGKLIKLAGGIFHTHNHLADGRLEILTAHCAQLGLPTSLIQQIYHSSTTESALQLLRQSDQLQGSNWVEQIYQNIATQIDLRSQDYIRKHSEQEVCVGSILFDRQRNIIQISKNAEDIVTKLC
ncbi:MAG: cobalt-precorrin-5B (C(1))-methyltransferase CbiD [Xenococcaceae cyanobacterium MO_188.B29]|nr:cobalt-precorrin-5B (C(1))-methyltransferase CbiD [Xenococcaceae cyanobacterium MO_188.B29]